MHRRPKPEPETYLRLILGIPSHLKILPANDQYRLDLAVSIVRFITKNHPKKKAMAEFVRSYAAKKGVSESFCYKILGKLKELTIVTWSDHYQEYHLNMERWKRDKKALDGFKAQVKDWERTILK